MKRHAPRKILSIYPYMPAQYEITAGNVYATKCGGWKIYVQGDYEADWFRDNTDCKICIKASDIQPPLGNIADIIWTHPPTKQETAIAMKSR